MSLRKNEELNELLKLVGVEDYCDHQGLDYEIRAGKSGPQVNLKECPACGGSSSKVYLNAESGLGNCFHGDCHVKTFNKFSFIKAVINATTVAEVKAHLREVCSELGFRRRTRAVVAVEMEKVACKLPESLALPTEAGENLNYLERRGLNGDVSAYFHYRYCIRGFHIFPRPEGGNGTQNFSDRVIIPVFDLDGTLQTFQGRDITGDAEKKYLFPAGLPGTGRFLYNGHNAIGAKHIIVCEGVFDVAAVKVALDKYPGVVDGVATGTFGKHLADGRDGADQVNKFIALVGFGLKEATMLWDGEAQALRDALSAASRLSRLGIKVKIAMLPKGKDPNEIVAGALISCLINAVPYTKALELRVKLNNPYR